MHARHVPRMHLTFQNLRNRGPTVCIQRAAETVVSLNSHISNRSLTSGIGAQSEILCMHFMVALLTLVFLLHAHARRDNSVRRNATPKCRCTELRRSHNVVEYVCRRCQSCLHDARDASQTPYMFTHTAKCANHVPEQPQFPI